MQEELKSLATLDEKYFKENMNVGLETIGPEDIPTPTITLIQNNSELVDEDGRPLPRGQFYYKGTQKVYKHVDCAILSVTKTELPEFNDREILSKAYIALGVIEGSHEPFLMYLKKTGIGAIKNLLGQIKAAQRPMYSLYVRISSELKQGDKGSYYVSKFNIIGKRDNASNIFELEKLAKKYGATIKTEDEYQVPVPEDLPFE